MRSWWLHRAETTSWHWGILQSGVKEGLRPWSSVKKGWISHSRLGVTALLTSGVKKEQEIYWQIRAVDLPVNLLFNPHVWSRAVGSNLKLLDQYKCQQWASSEGLLNSPSGIGLGNWPYGGGLEALFFHIKRSQLRWFEQVVRMSSRCLPGEVFQTCPTEGLRADPGPARETISFGWHGKYLCPLRRGGWGEGDLRISA